MRTRTRAVQIFNMSLIDILCGALGAFCFMMLVLLPYYKPPGSATDLHKQEAQTQDLLKELERLKDAAKDSALAQQMADTIRRLEEQLKQMQGLLNQLTAENETLKEENQSLAAKNLEQTLALSTRRPFVTLVSAMPRRDIDLYLQKEVVIVGEKSNPPFDPTVPHQPTFWAGDINAYATGSATWMVRDIGPNVRYKVYVKLVTEAGAGFPFGQSAAPAARIPTVVEGMVVGENGRWSVQLPRVVLTAERFWSLAGTLTGEADGTFSFKPATQEEQDAEWTKLSKGSPPPARPSATAEMSAEQRNALREMARKEREKMEKMRQQRQQQQPPVASPGGASPSAAEIGPGGMPPQDRGALIERLRQRQQQQRQSPPAASPTASP
jgi:hypothetical protein